MLPAVILQRNTVYRVMPEDIADDATCGICLESLKPPSIAVAHTGDNGKAHPMHLKCIQILEKCAFCREPFDIDAVHQAWNEMAPWKDKFNQWQDRAVVQIHQWGNNITSNPDAHSGYFGGIVVTVLNSGIGAINSNNDYESIMNKISASIIILTGMYFLIQSIKTVRLGERPLSEIVPNIKLVMTAGVLGGLGAACMLPSTIIPESLTLTSMLPTSLQLKLLEYAEVTIASYASPLINPILRAYIIPMSGLAAGAITGYIARMADAAADAALRDLFRSLNGR